MDKVSKSTAWYRANKEKVHKQQNAQKRTLNGKLANLITTSKHRAKIKGIEHNINVAFIRKLYQQQEGRCAITDIEMIIRGESCAANSPYSISLDRIDSAKGYTEDNVWLVCTGVNLMKARLSMDEFINFCSKVVEKFV